MNFKFTDNVNVRSGPNTQTDRFAPYHPGETVKIDKIHFDSDGKTGVVILEEVGKPDMFA